MTPALLVPDTPEGKLYKQLPSILAQIANKVQEQSARLNLVSALNGWMTEGAAEHLHLLMLEQLADFDFGTAQQIGAAGMLRWLQSMPLFTWDVNAPAVQMQIWIDVANEVKRVSLPIQERREGLYAIHPAFAYAYLGMMPNRSGQRVYINEGGSFCFAVYDPQHGVLFSQGLVNTTGAALSNMVNQLQQGADYQAIGRTAWTPLPEFYTIREDAIRLEYGIDSRGNAQTYELNPEYSEAQIYPWPSIFANHPNVLVAPFAELGTKLNRARARKNRAEMLQLIGMVTAIMGGFAAIESIASQGASFTNVAKLIGSIDNLPGVDLGEAGKIVKGFSGGVNLAQQIPGGIAMFDFPELDIELSLEDIGATVAPDFDLSIFDDFGLEAGDLIPDDFGNVFTVSGDAVQLTPEAYIKSIYIDEGGNYRDYTNNIVLSQTDAEITFNESGADNDAVLQKLMTNAQALSGNSFVAQDGPNGRPAGTPSPAARGEVPFFQTVSQEVLSWFKTITSYSLAKEQLDKTGRYQPPYQTSPQGQPYSQVPGVPVRRADGSTVTNNGNGTQTVQYPDGRVQTVPTNLNPGQFSGGQFMGGGQLIPGVSNQTLLLAGAGLLAALLIARR